MTVEIDTQRPTTCGCLVAHDCELHGAAGEMAMSLRVILETACIDADDARIALDALAQIRYEARRALGTLTPEEPA